MTPSVIPFGRRDARRGLFWLRRGHAMFRAAPLPWLLLLVVYYVLVALAELGPWPALGKLAGKPVLFIWGDRDRAVLLPSGRLLHRILHHF